MIDTHAHLNFSAFDNNREELINELIKNNYSVINIGTNYYSSQKAIEISIKYNLMYASVGLHPLNIESTYLIKKYGPSGTKENKLESEYLINSYKDIASSNKVVAIGEIGLDYWYKPKGSNEREEYKKKQEKVFQEQLDLAEELNLPVIIHSRMAFNDTYRILSKRKLKGTMHCFVGGVKEMDAFLSLGYYMGFNGIIFKINMQEVLKHVPLKSLILETDCPYLSPPGFISEINNPFSMDIIIREIAKIKGQDIDKLKDITIQNAKQLFSI